MGGLVLLRPCRNPAVLDLDGGLRAGEHEFHAHEDTALKAYHQTRSRYLADLPPRYAFNQIGEVVPTVIIDGTVAGTWSWNTRTATISTDLIPGRTTPATRRQVRPAPPR